MSEERYEQNQAALTFRLALGLPGRLITMSKGRYRHSNPNHLVIYNALVWNDDCSSLWRGDIDITLEKTKLMSIANQAGTFYITYEGKHLLKGKADRHNTACTVTSNGITLNDTLDEYYDSNIVLREEYGPKPFDLDDACECDHSVPLENYCVLDQTSLPATLYDVNSNPLEVLDSTIRKYLKFDLEKGEDFAINPKTGTHIRHAIVKYMQHNNKINSQYELEQVAHQSVLSLPIFIKELPEETIYVVRRK